MGYRFWIFIAGVSGAIAVAAGALGAHLLDLRFTEEELLLYRTAQNWHLVHSLALFGVGLLIRGFKCTFSPRSAWPAQIAGFSFLFGILLFSGALYLKVMVGGRPALPFIPVGGGLFVVGWLAIAVSAFRLPKLWTSVPNPMGN